MEIEQCPGTNSGAGDIWPLPNRTALARTPFLAAGGCRVAGSGNNTGSNASSGAGADETALMARRRQ